MKNRFLGAHMSVEGGLFRALERAKSIECTALQLFTRNASQWAAKELSPEAIRSFKKLRRQTGIKPVFAHCSYLINLGPSPFFEKSVDGLALEISRGNLLGLEFVVLHPGAHLGKGTEEGLRSVVHGLNLATKATEGMRCRIAIENTAGQGSCLGCTFDHLQYILNNVEQPDRFGVCIDTCHMFAAGYDIRTRETYERSMSELLKAVPKKKILAFHLNDSKKPLGSRVDRHEHIGKGQIGVEGFRMLLNDRRFSRIPMVLETPKEKDLAEDIENLSLLRSLIAE